MAVFADFAFRLVTAAACRLSIAGCRKSQVAFRVSCLLAVSLVSLTVFGEEIDVAKEALRDGLWDVARAHALRAGEGRAESRAVIAETYAREGKWGELLSALEKWQNPDDDRLVYYRALALFETGKTDQAEFVISNRKFAESAYTRLANRLAARILLAKGNPLEALKLVKTSEGSGDEDSEMFAAELMSMTGDEVGAKEIWKSVAERGTNASERAFAIASVKLGDAGLLEKAYERSVSADSKRMSGYALGRVLLASKQTLDKGVSLIRSLVRESPDATGAREGLAAVAEAYLRNERYKDSVDVYKEVFDTWPDAAKVSSYYDGLGWALAKLGRNDEALGAYATAEDLATTDAERAMEIVRQGDVLAAAGKSEAALEKYRGVLVKYPATDSAARIKDLVKLRDLEDRGRECYREYRFAAAQEIFSEVGRKDPSRKARMDYLSVMCMYGQGLDDDAERAARRLVAECGDAEVKSLAMLWLAKHSFNGSSWSEARKLFFEFAMAAPDSPDAPDALVWSARAAFAESDFKSAIQIVTFLDGRYPESPARVRGALVQGEALIELARFDEAVLVLERSAMGDDVPVDDRLRARLLKADALFAMGADNSVRYQEALEAYKGVKMGETLDPSQRLIVSYKIAKTLEKLKRTDEAVDRYYSDVVLAYREGRLHAIRFDDEARASFSRAAFRLADEFESRGRDYQAVHVLELVSTSDVPAAVEARKRIDRIHRKGRFL